MRIFKVLKYEFAEIRKNFSNIILARDRYPDLIQKSKDVDGLDMNSFLSEKQRRHKFFIECKQLIPISLLFNSFTFIGYKVWPLILLSCICLGVRAMLQKIDPGLKRRWIDDWWLRWRLGIWIGVVISSPRFLLHLVFLELLHSRYNSFLEPTTVGYNPWLGWLLFFLVALFICVVAYKDISREIQCKFWGHYIKAPITEIDVDALGILYTATFLNIIALTWLMPATHGELAFILLAMWCVLWYLVRVTPPLDYRIILSLLAVLIRAISVYICIDLVFILACHLPLVFWKHLYSPWRLYWAASVELRWFLKWLFRRK